MWLYSIMMAGGYWTTSQIGLRKLPRSGMAHSRCDLKTMKTCAPTAHYHSSMLTSSGQPNPRQPCKRCGCCLAFGSSYSPIGNVLDGLKVKNRRDNIATNKTQNISPLETMPVRSCSSAPTSVYCICDKEESGISQPTHWARTGCERCISMRMQLWSVHAWGLPMSPPSVIICVRTEERWEWPGKVYIRWSTFSGDVQRLKCFWVIFDILLLQPLRHITSALRPHTISHWCHNAPDIWKWGKLSVAYVISRTPSADLWTRHSITE